MGCICGCSGAIGHGNVDSMLGLMVHRCAGGSDSMSLLQASLGAGKGSIRASQCGKVKSLLR